MFEIDELKGKCKGKEKSVKIGKTITEMMVRNTVSELKDYRERSPEKKDMRDTERNFQKIKKKVKTQEKVIKKGKK